MPTLLALWPPHSLEKVRLLILGGEACPPELGVGSARPGREELWNAYGPTEATVVACAALLGTEPVRIGLPLAGWDLAVVDADGVQVAEGASGGGSHEYHALPTPLAAASTLFRAHVNGVGPTKVPQALDTAATAPVTQASSLRPGRRLAAARGARRPRFRQKCCKKAERREKGANMVNEIDGSMVGEPAEDCRADAGHAEGEAEEEARDHADASGQEPLRIDDDGRKRRGDDDADDDAEDGRPE